MKSKYELFDRARPQIKPLAERAHDLGLDHWLALEDLAPPYSHPQLPEVAARIVAARRRIVMRAQVLRAGVNRHVIDPMERSWLDHLALNGAGAIHNYELARIAGTTEKTSPATSAPASSACGKRPAS
jgi:hypothetical protein